MNCLRGLSLFRRTRMRSTSRSRMDADRDVTAPDGRTRVPPDDPSYLLRRVWLSKAEEEGYYYGFANSTLWPLCHQVYCRPTFDPAHWETYRSVNEQFAAAVLE